MATTTDIVWRGAEQLRPLLVPIDELEEWPGNPRRGDEEKIARSLDEFGQQKNIRVQSSTRRIVAGNHTRRSAKRLGWTHIAAVVEEMDDDVARDFLLADNKSTDDASYDEGELLALVQESADAGTLDRTLYSGDELDDLLVGQGGKEAEYQETGAEHAPDDERWGTNEDGEPQRIGSTGPIREIRLVFDQEGYEKFGTYIRMLRAEWGTAGIIETVLRAVEEAARKQEPEEA